MTGNSNGEIADYDYALARVCLVNKFGQKFYVTSHGGFLERTRRKQNICDDARKSSPVITTNLSHFGATVEPGLAAARTSLTQNNLDPEVMEGD